MSKATKLKHQLGSHAVVIGGSLGGLLSARVLSDYYERVTIIERDAVAESVEPRNGVPQGRHVHVIYGGGAKAIEEVLPGFFEELVQAGSMKLDFCNDLAWYHGGVWKLRTETDLVSYWQSRPFLEAHVRRRVKSDTDVEFLEEMEVRSLVADESKSRVKGVEVRQIGGDGELTTIDADLVIDASGRNSRVPQWLEDLGYSKLGESTVDVNLGYASRIYERPSDDLRDWKILGLFGTAPSGKKTGYIFPIEGQRWIATEVGYLEDYPPDDDDTYLQFASELERPDFYDALKDAKPLTPIVTYRFPSHRWRHFERLQRLPQGLLAVGDSICSFNPVYGQGMSACALEVKLLAQMLANLGAGNGLPADFAQRFFGRASKIVANPWLLATNSDFMYPGTGGRRPLGTKLLNWYVKHVFRLCASNKGVCLRFHRVLHFINGPTALFHPYVMLQVFKSALGLVQKPLQQRPGPSGL
ncbi:MAG: FAD-dependent monooxygenase [Planctomycetes bacterium]|nr:FAD-dependent monooxygenase [Planctomycetota bacterium]